MKVLDDRLRTVWGRLCLCIGCVLLLVHDVAPEEVIALGRRKATRASDAAGKMLGCRRHAVAPIAGLFYCVEQMPRGDLLGSLEHLVLLALVRLGADAYGMTVRREIEDRTGRSLSIGAIYATLERLETKGLIDSSVGEPTAERGGRAKRHFRMTADGELALNASQEAIRRMTLGLRRRWSTT